jgi:uncharacterized membrane protein
MKNPKSMQDSSETDDDNEDSPLVKVAAGVVTTVVLAVAFIGLAVGFPWFWVAFPVGFGGLLPLAIGIVKWWEEQQQTRTSGIPDDMDASSPERELSILREHYARGEIDEDEFETRLERLLNTESISDAAQYADRERDQERETERI